MKTYFNNRIVIFLLLLFIFIVIIGVVLYREQSISGFMGTFGGTLFGSFFSYLIAVWQIKKENDINLKTQFESTKNNVLAELGVTTARITSYMERTRTYITNLKNAENTNKGVSVNTPFSNDNFFGDNIDKLFELFNGADRSIWKAREEIYGHGFEDIKKLDVHFSKIIDFNNQIRDSLAYLNQIQNSEHFNFERYQKRVSVIIQNKNNITKRSQLVVNEINRLRKGSKINIL